MSRDADRPASFSSRRAWLRKATGTAAVFGAGSLWGGLAEACCLFRRHGHRRQQVYAPTIVCAPYATYQWCPYEVIGTGDTQWDVFLVKYRMPGCTPSGNPRMATYSYNPSVGCGSAGCFPFSPFLLDYPVDPNDATETSPLNPNFLHGPRSDGQDLRTVGWPKVNGALPADFTLASVTGTVTGYTSTTYNVSIGGTVRTMKFISYRAVGDANLSSFAEEVRVGRQIADDPMAAAFPAGAKVVDASAGYNKYKYVRFKDGGGRWEPYVYHTIPSE